MKKNRTKKAINQHEVETNRLLCATVVAIAALFGLLLVHRGMSGSAIMGTRDAMAAIAVILCIYASIHAVYALAIRRDWTLAEYPLFALVYAFGLYCIRGVWFVNSLHSLYGMVVVCVGYLVVSFVFHSVRMKKLSRA